MKWIVVLLVASLLLYGCGPTPTPTPDIEATVEAAMTQTAVAVAQTAIVETQTAMAKVSPTDTPTLTPVPPTSIPTFVPPTDTPTPSLSPTPSPTETPAPSPSLTTPVPTSTPLVSCLFYVYAERGSEDNLYVPEGWMGDWADITFDDNYRLDPDPSRPSVIQIIYTPAGSNGWAGIYWWDPPGSDWGKKDGGYDLSCATKLTLWARGEKGGEKAEFKVGGLKGIYQDSLQPALSTGPIVLTNQWTQYSLDLSGRDLSHIIGGFVWVTNKPGNPAGATIYLDDIIFE